MAIETSTRQPLKNVLRNAGAGSVEKPLDLTNEEKGLLFRIDVVSGRSENKIVKLDELIDELKNSRISPFRILIFPGNPKELVDTLNKFGENGLIQVKNKGQSDMEIILTKKGLKEVTEIRRNILPLE